MAAHDLHHLRHPGGPPGADAPGAVVTVAPSSGGRIAQLEIDGRPFLVGGDHTSEPSMWGAFPMAPWAGRVRNGRFDFDGVTYELPKNLPPHAIHGTTFDRPWTVTRHDATSVEMLIDLDWPFGGRATQEVTLGPASVTCVLAVHADATPMPAEIGWHPWFVDPESVVFRPGARYVRGADGIPTGELVELEPSTGPGAGPFDDCFINTEPVTVGRGGTTLRLTSDCDHWVLFDEPDDATCVEPQSGPPDAFTIRPRRLAAGTELRRTFTIAW